MVWLGGLSVALAGIFMVHYSVSEGLIGPVLQLLIALASGLGLHAGAETLRRRYNRSDQIFAALAGGGSVTLYAALLAGIHYYELIGPLSGLLLLAIVSLATMALARLHGPLLAIMGLSGAYVVPLLIASDHGSVAFVLAYSFLITFSSLLLMRYVFRDWLWYATLAGAMLWWLAALFSADIGPSVPLYLALLLVIFSMLPRLAKIDSSRLREAFIALLAAWGMSVAGQSADHPLFFSWLLILPVALLTPQSRGALWYLPWGAVLASAAGWLLYMAHNSIDFFHLAQLPTGQHSRFITYLVISTLICASLGLWQWRADNKRRWASFTVLSPLVWLVLGWLLLHGVETSTDWALAALLTGTVYGALTWWIQGHVHYQNGRVWATLAAHLSYSLAVVMAFREATLTLALAVQFVSLVWLARHYRMPELYLLLKVVLAVVVVRLTFNPWLQGYDATVHWTLWTYGGATLLAAIATKMADSSHTIRPWLEAATLHLLVLFLGAELRYWLYDGDIFSHEYSFIEATVNMLLWGGLSITYMIRAKASLQLTWLYRWCALILLGLSSVSYLVLVILYNPLWNLGNVSDTPIFNMLLPAYGGPVLLALALSRFPLLAPKLWVWGVAAVALMLFTGLEIRQLWQGSDMSLSSGMSSGELYTYSVVGMLYAIAAIIYATKKSYPLFYKAGMVLLGLVIAKIFLIDMDGLQGLWRVAAFMGLGLALLGLAWVHQKVQRASGQIEAGS
ncbi:membrane protein [Oceanisphaera arctica]|nr:membrane protein [Oceanisphaera arctica]